MSIFLTAVPILYKASVHEKCCCNCTYLSEHGFQNRIYTDALAKSLEPDTVLGMRQPRDFQITSWQSARGEVPPLPADTFHPTAVRAEETPGRTWSPPRSPWP